MAGWKVSQSAADPSVLEPLTDLPWNIALDGASGDRRERGRRAGRATPSAPGAGGRCSTDTGGYVGIGAEDLDRADRWFERWGSLGGLPRSHGAAGPHLRQLPGRDQPHADGQLHRLQHAGLAAWNAALIYAGFVVGENYPQIEAALKPFEYVIYAVVFLVVAYFVARWWWGKRRRAARRLTGPRATCHDLRQSNEPSSSGRGGSPHRRSARHLGQPANRIGPCRCGRPDPRLAPGQTGPTVTVRKGEGDRDANRWRIRRSHGRAGPRSARPSVNAPATSTGSAHELASPPPNAALDVRVRGVGMRFATAGGRGQGTRPAQPRRAGRLVHGDHRPERLRQEHAAAARGRPARAADGHGRWWATRRPAPGDGRVGLAFQQPRLVPWRSTLDNVALPLEVAGVRRRASGARRPARPWSASASAARPSFVRASCRAAWRSAPRWRAR